MKLPENKRERQKIAGLIAVVVLGALYGVWAFVYDPIRTKREDALEQIIDIERNLRRAETQIARVPQMESDLKSIAAELVEMSEQHMLHPRLGNYLLTAREIFAQHAARAGVNAYRTEEVGLVALPRGGDRADAAQTVQAYAMRVMMNGGYEDFRRLVRDMEEANPYVSFSAFLVAAQSDQPQRHLITFEVQWPVWVDPAMRMTIREEARDVLSGEGG